MTEARGNEREPRLVERERENGEPPGGKHSNSLFGWKQRTETGTGSDRHPVRRGQVA
jgi:hypothetical protein